MSFAVIANIDPSASFVAEAGEIEITRFDTAILSGRFEFSAKEQYGDGRSVIVKGQFNYPCKSSDACSAN